MIVQGKAWLVGCGLAALPLLMPQRADGQESSLIAARQLYAAAEYNSALMMLNGLLAGSPSADERQALELYRVLCLVAVGNTAEADRAIETMIVRDPLYRPGTEDVPPRLRAAFSDTRKRLLPSIIQQAYLMAKSAFDQQNLTAAAEGFKQVLNGLSDPDIAPLVEQPPLSDLRVLAAGFHDLSSKATALATPPSSVVPAPSPVPEPRARIVTRIYSDGDPGVVPPVVVRQTMPPFPGKVLLAGVAVIEVLIGETGTVESVVMAPPLNPAYDRLALAAAKAWQYRPATVNGEPVKFKRRVQISLVPNQPNR